MSTAQLEERVRGRSLEQQRELIETFARAHPTNPIVDGMDVSFLVSSAEPPQLIGDFNGWDAASGARGRMRRIGDSNWFASTVQVPLDARVEYMISRGDAVETDQRNPKRVPSVGGDASEVVMPGYEPHAELAPSTGPAGVVQEHTLPGTEDAAPRRVAIYTPPGYAASKRYPVVFFHDGTLMLQRGVPAILDALQEQKRIAPLVAVFVDPLSRAEDYKASDSFRRFFLDELVPWAEQRVRMSANPAERAVVGVSRGAIAALDLAMHAPERFGRCGLLIPSFAPTRILEVLSESPTRPISFAVVAAAFDRQWLRDAQTLEGILDAKGYERRMQVVQEGHNVQAWRAHIDEVLVPFFGGLR
jgi:enterochelin esterase-like enzyme